MLYTFTKKCAEVPDLCYDDGVVHYYFNTTGTKGGSKELKAFLTYLEDSISDNAIDPNTKSISQLVDYIKTNETVRGDYMTMDYLLEKYKNEAMELGEKRGLEIGEKRGLELGEKRGLELGEKRGLEIGEKKGLEIGIKVIILNAKEKNESKDSVLNLLINGFDLSHQKAEEYYNLYV